MQHKTDSHDREHLTALMMDFPVASPIDAYQAAKLLHRRFTSLSIDQFTKALQPLNEEEFIKRFQEIPLKMHGYLFKDILGNAGRYRHRDDPGDGSILFGPNQRYSGSAPANIASEMKRVGSQLIKNDSDPVKTIVWFYQQFVYIHPFYDANGRIGRFVTTLYLDYHGYFMSWKGLHQNQKWLKKLNACHNRMGAGRYDYYQDLLVKYWTQFIKPKEAIEPVS